MTHLTGVLIDVFFFDANNGLIIGSTAPTDGTLDAWDDLETVHAAVFMTTDGGETWTLQHQTNDFQEWGWKISFPTRTVSYVSVQGRNGAKVLKTTDGGLSWTEVVLEEGYGGSAIGFVTEQIGWTGGDQTALTNDGGLVWQDAGFGEQLNRIRVLGDSLAYAVGDRVYKYTHDQSTAAEVPNIPGTFQLEQNYPNPFNPSTTITYTVTVGTDVEIVALDLLGRHVATLTARPHEPGRHQVVWDGTDDAGTPVPSGLYLYRLTMGSYVQTKAMMLLK